jgi:hypothetical protein
LYLPALAVGLIWFGLGSRAAADMTIQAIQNNPGDSSLLGHYDRFDVIDRAAFSTNFVGDPFNWSGVGMGYFGASSLSGGWAAMISPSYFVSANHDNPSNHADPQNGVPVTALRFSYSNDPSGGYEEYSSNPADPRHFTAIGEIGNSDLWLGKLSVPVSSNVAKYPILNVPYGSSYYSSHPTIYTFGVGPGNGGSGYVLGQSQRLGRNQIDSVHQDLSDLMSPDLGYNFRFSYSNPGVGPDESLVQGGDSGAPDFVMINVNGTNMPALIGVNWFQTADGQGQPNGSGSTFIPQYISGGSGLQSLTSAMAGSGEQPTLVGLWKGFPQNVLTVRKGDFDLNGTVNISDMQAMLSSLNDLSGFESLHGLSDAYTVAMGDFNNDGKVTNADVQGLLIYIANGGQGSLAVVPEPSAAVLLVLGAWPVWRLARRGRVA